MMINSKSNFISIFNTFYSIFYFIAIFEIIVSLLLMCSLMLYVKRIMQFNQRYGRFAFALGIVFIIANVLAGGLNFYLGTGGWQPIQDLKSRSPVLWDMIFIPFYIITEFAPSVVFAVVMDKYGEEQMRHLRGGAEDNEIDGVNEE